MPSPEQTGEGRDAERVDESVTLVLGLLGVTPAIRVTPSDYLWGERRRDPVLVLVEEGGGVLDAVVRRVLGVA